VGRGNGGAQRLGEEEERTSTEEGGGQSGARCGRLGWRRLLY
jgi:hypothetical protein